MKTLSSLENSMIDEISYLINFSIQELEKEVIVPCHSRQETYGLIALQVFNKVYEQNCEYLKDYIGFNINVYPDGKVIIL